MQAGFLGQGATRVRRVRACARLAALVLWSLAFTPVGMAAALVGLVRRAALARIGPAVMRLYAPVTCAILGVRIVRDGAPPPGACILTPNHWGYVDIFVLGALERTVFVSRADVADWPVVGLFARAGGTLFIDRAARKDTVRVGDEVERHLRLRGRVTTFLEGGSGRGDAVRPFKSSLLEAAVATGVPCVPVALRYTLPCDPGMDASDVVGWGDATPVGTHLWRLLHARRIVATVRFLPPRTGTDRKELARALEADVGAALTAAGREA